MTPDQLARLRAEILTGPLALQLDPMVKKGQDADVANLLNAKGAVGAYTPATPPPDATPKESPADVLFGSPVTAEDVGRALRDPK